MVSDYLSPDGKVDPHFDQALEKDLGPALADVIRNLPAQKHGRSKTIKNLPRQTHTYVTEMARRHTPVDRYVYRNTRDLLRKYVKQGLLEANVPTRKPTIQRVSFRHEEEELYQRITEYITHFYQKYEKEKRGLGFIMTVYRRRLTSSFYAIRRSLERRRDWLEGLIISSEQLAEAEKLEEDEEFLEELEQAGFDIAELEQLTDAQKADFSLELDYLNEFIGDLRELSEADSKLSFLKNQLEELFYTRDTVLVFTLYTDTMDYIRRELSIVYGTGVACYSGRGGEQWNGIDWVETTKEIVKNEFRKGKIKILLCTESASEGLNLQTCGVLINYDMPWNPMRVEQRIGRIDRIGQKYKEVWIHNYFYRDSIEDRIYQALKDRIDWFETVVGDLQPILAEVGELTRKLAMMPAEAQAAEFQQKMKELRAKIDENRTEAFNLDNALQERELEQDTTSPVTLRDLEQILTTAQATNHLFRQHDSIDEAYFLNWDDSELLVTFNKDRFDEYPNSLTFLSYGSPLLEGLLALVPEPDSYPNGLIRFGIEDPIPLRGWYSPDNGTFIELSDLASLHKALSTTTESPSGADKELAGSLFESSVTATQQRLAERLAARTERRKKTLRAKSERLLLKAAMVEIALGQQSDLFSDKVYPTSFNETAVAGLRRHGKVWKWMLKIGYEPGLRPKKDDPYFSKVDNQPLETLRGLFGSLTREARIIVIEWLKLEGS
jgi:hypothetical protein